MLRGALGGPNVNVLQLHAESCPSAIPNDFGRTFALTRAEAARECTFKCKRYVRDPECGLLLVEPVSQALHAISLAIWDGCAARRTSRHCGNSPAACCSSVPQADVAPKKCGSESSTVLPLRRGKARRTDNSRCSDSLARPSPTVLWVRWRGAPPTHLTAKPGVFH